MDFEAVEAEITEIWCHLNAATHRFLELVAEFDRAEGWARHGVANCAQWLNLACGIGPVAAREKVRVARSLEVLPQVDAAFRQGELSYSKVRAITRVATPETEGTLLNVALHGTATHVERLVRHYRRVQHLEDAANAMEQHRNRFLHFRYDEDGSVSIYGRLPPEVGALVEKAVAAATSDTGNAPADEDADEYDREPIGARRADALRVIAQRFLAGESDRCSSSADRYQVVVHIDQAMLADESEARACGPHSGIVSSGRIDAGDGSSAILRSNRIAADDRSSAATCSSDRSLCEIEDRCMLAVETARRLACDSTLVGIVEDSDGEPLNVGRKTRAISPALRRALKSRDGGCRFPGCDRTQYTEGHHARHWADGGETKLGNLVTLCSFHHRLIHEGGFGLRVTDDGAFVFTRPDGTRIVAGQRLRMRDFERQGADRQHRDRQHRDGQQGGGPGGW